MTNTIKDLLNNFTRIYLNELSVKDVKVKFMSDEKFNTLSSNDEKLNLLTFRLLKDWFSKYPTKYDTDFLKKLIFNYDGAFQTAVTDVLGDNILFENIYNRKSNNLYESIMKDVSKIVKKHLAELK